MKLGIIGLSQSGKTTLFNTLSGQQETVGDFSQTVHRAVIKVPDERLDNLATMIEPKKITHAEIEFLDVAGFTGRSKKPNSESDIFHDLRLMDAIIIVVDDFSHSAKPEKDFRSICDELILADLVIIEKNIDKIEKAIKLTGNRERAQELEILIRCREALNNEQLLSTIGLTQDDRRIVRGYAFLTLKPYLITFNIAEEKLADHSKIYNNYSKYRQKGVADIAVICGKIEMELGQLEQEDRNEFLRELNIESSAIEKFIRRSYALLGLISFFTIGPPECRAWTIREGTKAPKAAGEVHTDIERGFIRAEVAKYEDYMVYKKLPALKAAAKLHVEGKEYIVSDGDVILFLFNV